MQLRRGNSVRLRSSGSAGPPLIPGDSADRPMQIRFAILVQRVGNPRSRIEFFEIASFQTTQTDNVRSDVSGPWIVRSAEAIFGYRQRLLGVVLQDKCDGAYRCAFTSNGGVFRRILVAEITFDLPEEFQCFLEANHESHSPGDREFELGCAARPLETGAASQE